MARNIVYIATSMDGFIAAKDGDLDWLMDIPNPGQSDFGFADFMAGIDALVMGRNTFEQVLSFGQWPYPMPVFVLSTTLSTIPEGFQGKVDFMKGDPETVVASLNERGFRNLYIDGGLVIQAFLAADLIDEMIITTASVVLGEGVPLFGALDGALEFKLEKSEVLGDFLIKNSFTRFRGLAN